MKDRETTDEQHAQQGPDAAEEGVLTLACFKCGTEYYFGDTEPPSTLRCEKCGNTVFRSFHTVEGDEAADDFRDSTERDLAPDDAEGDAMPGDVLDLNRD
jgi:predicted  nucleic acid-binding Zn-ribbon protein